MTQTEEINNLFIAFTPYHILLSCAVALRECPGENNHLVIRPSFSQSQMLTSVISGWRESPFDKVTCIRGVYGVINEARKRLIYRLNLQKLQAMVKGKLLRRLYVGTDGSPETQAALYFAKSSNREAIGIYIEDGSAAYSEARFPERRLWKTGLEKIFYGTWWEYIRIHGTSKWIDEARLVYPEFARPELSTKVLKKIDRSKMLSLQEASWVKEYLSCLGLRPEILNSIDGLLLLPRSVRVGGISELNSIIEKFIDYAAQCNQKIGIKCHPRDIPQKLAPKDQGEYVLMLPASLPIELLYLCAGSQLKFVVAAMSTTLLTARWLLSNANLICMKSFSGHLDKRISNIFNDLGIRLVTSVDEIGN